ncbi:hypothetical protein CEE69_02825 [Rhodopirellula bahusiensis]|uniref:Uncharacterized protein n=1 Tax=Rhodopirellula bahusiensis TaxID=2014065 RepID=A0A2G1WBF3_9BACT|nr:hypothetical protein CEE69_02825 [Rhodopirellula bahusiensis]
MTDRGKPCRLLENGKAYSQLKIKPPSRRRLRDVAVKTFSIRTAASWDTIGSTIRRLHRRRVAGWELGG